MTMLEERKTEVKQKATGFYVAFLGISFIVMLVVFTAVNLVTFSNLTSGPLTTDKQVYAQGELITLSAHDFCWDGTAYISMPFFSRNNVHRELPLTIHDGWTTDEAKVLEDAPGHCIHSVKGVPVAQVAIPIDGRPGSHYIDFTNTYHPLWWAPWHTETVKVRSNDFLVTGPPPPGAPMR